MNLTAALNVISEPDINLYIAILGVVLSSLSLLWHVRNSIEKLKIITYNCEKDTLDKSFFGITLINKGIDTNIYRIQLFHKISFFNSKKLELFLGGLGDSKFSKNYYPFPVLIQKNERKMRSLFYDRIFDILDESEEFEDKEKVKLYFEVELSSGKKIKSKTLTIDLRDDK